MEQKNRLTVERSASKQENGAEKSSNTRKKCVKTGEWSRKSASNIERLYRKNLKRMKKEKDSYF
ncbi:hypothetical protein [Metabacillus hrfriensis]|uniref:Uncharacterized protein n=1 Tax=Metabacillus hrfriensis TaxID=3048891 RepID=A0ACD4RG08_9BACI|nr:hypothetical protein [Metabacillus sp. CT-WN-B3]WHZ59388.1 hypothetical protein QLQ22_08715 [Metabacillus sp. CT-WN-B3]